MSLPRNTTNEICNYIKEHSTQLFGHKFWNVRVCYYLSFSLKPEKLDNKFFVISKFRLFLVNGKTSTSLKIEKSFNILCIRAINILSNNQLSISFEEGGSIKKYYIKTDEGLTEKEIQLHILGSLKHYFPTIGPCINNFIELEKNWDTDYDKLPNCYPYLPCNDFRKSYAAICDLYDQQVKEEVIWDIEKIYAASSISILRLEDFTHLSSKDIAAIVSVAQFSSFFNGISVDSVKLTNEIIDAILCVVRRSPYLKTLILKSCGLTKDFLNTLSAYIRQNNYCQIETLDLSGNIIDDKKIFSLFGGSIATLSDTIKYLNFGNCIHEKSLDHFCSNVIKNLQEGIHLNINELILSNNYLKDDVKEFCNFLTYCPKLRVLDLSDTQFPLEKLFTIISSTNLIHSLENLILSNTTISKKSKENTTEIKELFSKFSSLKVLSFAYSSIPSEIWTAIITAGAVEKGSSVLKCHMDQLKFVTELNLRDNNLESDWIQIIAATGRMPILRKLDIGGSTFLHLKKGSKQSLNVLSDTLLELTKIISDDFSNLEELIISDSLQVNTSLKTLLLDRNQISLEGFIDIMNGLHLNHQLLSIPYPIYDVTEAMNKPDKAKVISVIYQIEDLLARNRMKKEKEMLKCHVTFRRFQHKMSYLVGDLNEEKKDILYHLSDVIPSVKKFNLDDHSTIVNNNIEKFIEAIIPLYEKESLCSLDKLKQVIHYDYGFNGKVKNNPVKEFKWHNVGDMCEEFMDMLENLRPNPDYEMLRRNGCSTPLVMPSIRNNSLGKNTKMIDKSNENSQSLTLLPVSSPLPNLNQGRPKAPRNLKNKKNNEMSSSYKDSNVGDQDIASPSFGRHAFLSLSQTSNENDNVPVLPPLSSTNTTSSPVDSQLSLTEDGMTNSSISHSSNSLTRNLNQTTKYPLTPPPLLPRFSKGSLGQHHPPQLPPKPGNLFGTKTSTDVEE
ncbi:Leucine-rich repeat, ribonuclease inhibitor subtype-containing protein [Strongyloides ratti]|uniref:Leucine-rich repeat, ribonuclease inhibitor subtype-containing protein n=1 Tax=Strongyloides ratti TaxID=34506 RepID=A0A090L6V8_STRRB|nr:Leucine-rich repeat, ribonuclease inhibitor subtype-containing protein [Strongyloides ratti]CEF65531.2 Leucine-rich repeat, ribonuclease inhibitor subtype-containing protein [Strongyloides ratti]